MSFPVDFCLFHPDSIGSSFSRNAIDQAAPSQDILTTPSFEYLRASLSFLVYVFLSTRLSLSHFKAVPSEGGNTRCADPQRLCIQRSLYACKYCSRNSPPCLQDDKEEEDKFYLVLTLVAPQLKGDASDEANPFIARVSDSEFMKLYIEHKESDESWHRGKPARQDTAMWASLSKSRQMSTVNNTWLGSLPSTMAITNRFEEMTGGVQCCPLLTSPA